MAKVNKKEHKKRNSFLAFLRWLLILILVGVISYCSCYLYDFFQSNRHSQEQVKNIQDVIDDTKDDSDDENQFTFNKDTWEKLYAQNNDLMAFLHFDDNSINLPIVQAGDDNYYLRRGWDKSYDVCGTPFFDSETKISDDNMIIYGHSVDYAPSMMFTPLTKYETQDGYNTCHTFSLYFQSLKKDYVVIDAYYINSAQSANYDFLQKNFANQDDYNAWRSYPDSNDLIDASDKPEYGKKFVTLQTCKPFTNAATKLIVVGMEVNEEPY